MRVAALFAVVVLSGCSVSPIQQQQRPALAEDPSSACFGRIPSNPRLAAVSQKIPLGDPRSATVEMLTDRSMASEDEKAAISLWAKERVECADVGRQFRATYAPPRYATAYDDGQMRITQAIASLYAGQFTYGQFNAERQRLAAQFQSSLVEAQLSAQRENQDREAARRNAALQQLQTIQLLQAMQPKPTSLPVTPAVNCTSTRAGNVIDTTCR